MMLLRLAGACCLCLVATVAGFVALQALALTLTSDTAISARLRESLDRGALIERSYPDSPLGQRIDNFTECIALGTNLDNRDLGLLRRLALTPNVGHPSTQDACPALAAALRDGTAQAKGNYFRYWHGHQVYLRPLLALTTLDRVHLLNALLLAGALTLLCLHLGRWFGPIAGMAFPAAFVLQSDLVSLPWVTVHCLSISWAFASAAIAGLALERGDNLANRTLIFWTGAVGSFFDLLFNPPLAPTLIAVIAIRHSLLADPRTTSGRWHALMRGTAIATLWFSGFALAAACKWVFAAGIMGVPEVLGNIYGQALHHALGDGTRPTFFLAGTIYSAARTGIGLTLVWWLLAVAMIWRAKATSGLRREDVWHAALLMAPLAIPIIWVEVLRHHSVNHFFVARTFVLYGAVPVLVASAIAGRIFGRQANDGVAQTQMTHKRK